MRRNREYVNCLCSVQQVKNLKTMSSRALSLAIHPFVCRQWAEKLMLLKVDQSLSGSAFKINQKTKWIAIWNKSDSTRKRNPTVNRHFSQHKSANERTPTQPFIFPHFALILVELWNAKKKKKKTSTRKRENSKKKEQRTPPRKGFHISFIELKAATAAVVVVDRVERSEQVCGGWLTRRQGIRK